MASFCILETAVNVPEHLIKYKVDKDTDLGKLVTIKNSKYFNPKLPHKTKVVPKAKLEPKVIPCAKQAELKRFIYSDVQREVTNDIPEEFIVTSRTISNFARSLGAPLQQIVSNFKKYTERVGVTRNTNNFLFYLRNWADLDLRIGVSNESEGSHNDKEALLNKLQNSVNAKLGMPVTSWQQSGTTYYSVVGTR